jgi:alcohol dehydrogenase class IV
VDELSPQVAAARSFAAVRTLARDIGIPGGLGELGLKEEHIAGVAAEAVKSGNVAVNPRRAGVEDLRCVLQESL